MKIIHVTQHLGIGGLEKIIFHILLEQKKLGHDVSIYVYDHNRDWVDYFKSKDINVLTPPVKKSGYNISTFLQMNHDLMNADIIHTHDLNPIMYLGPIIFLRKFLFLKNPKLIHSTHGLSHIERHPYYIHFERLIVTMADRIIGVSSKVSDFYLKNLWWGKKKVVTIENGIKTFDHEITKELKQEQKKWLCERHNLDHTRPILLSLSRIVPLKNQKFLIEALLERPDYQLIIAGPGQDKEYFNELKKYESDRIKLVGAQELVSEYNLGSDAYLSSSTHEGIPVALLEAMAVKTPVLASNIPGHMTLNQYDHLIEIFELDNKENFLKQFDRMMKLIQENNTEFNSQINKAFSKVNEVYSVTSMVKNYLIEYNK